MPESNPYVVPFDQHNVCGLVGNHSTDILQNSLHNGFQIETTGKYSGDIAERIRKGPLFPFCQFDATLLSNILDYRNPADQIAVSTSDGRCRIEEKLACTVMALDF